MCAACAARFETSLSRVMGEFGFCLHTLHKAVSAIRLIPHAVSTSHYPPYDSSVMTTERAPNIRGQDRADLVDDV